MTTSKFTLAALAFTTAMTASGMAFSNSVADALSTSLSTAVADAANENNINLSPTQISDISNKVASDNDLTSITDVNSKNVNDIATDIAAEMSFVSGIDIANNPQINTDIATHLANDVNTAAEQAQEQEQKLTSSISDDDTTTTNIKSKSKSSIIDFGSNNFGNGQALQDCHKKVTQNLKLGVSDIGFDFGRDTVDYDTYCMENKYANQEIQATLNIAVGTEGEGKVREALVNVHAYKGLIAASESAAKGDTAVRGALGTILSGVVNAGAYETDAAKATWKADAAPGDIAVDSYRNAKKKAAYTGNGFDF